MTPSGSVWSRHTTCPRIFSWQLWRFPLLCVNLLEFSSSSRFRRSIGYIRRSSVRTTCDTEAVAETSIFMSSTRQSAATGAIAGGGLSWSR